MSKSKSTRTGNEQRSDVKNPNNDEHKKAEENTAKQKEQTQQETKNNK